MNKKFKDIFWFAPKSKIKAGEGLNKGRFPFYTSSQIQSKWIDKEQYFDESLIFGTGGSASIHYQNQPFSTSTDCFVSISTDKNVNTKYVYYYLLGNIHILQLGFNGAGLEHISKEYIEEIEIPFPDLETQNKIVAILDKAKLTLDKQEVVIQKYDELLRATFLEFFGDPVLNSKGWNLLKMSEVGHSRLGKMLNEKTITGKKLKPYLRNSNVLWLKFRLNNISEMDFSENDREEFRLKYGDVLMCEGGEIGRCAIWKDEIEEMYFQKAIHRIRFNNQLIDPEYFVYMFWVYTAIGGLKRYMGAATISHLTGEELKKLQIPVPPIELQVKFSNVVRKIETIKNKCILQISNLKTLFDALAQLTFNGALDFNTAVDLEVLLEKDYVFFAKNSNAKTIQLLLERLDKNELNENKFYDQELYNKAKSFVFELLKEDKIKQVFDKKTNRVKLSLK